jgi:hypothetical protein
MLVALTHPSGDQGSVVEKSENVWPLMSNVLLMVLDASLPIRAHFDYQAITFVIFNNHDITSSAL